MINPSIIEAQVLRGKTKMILTKLWKDVSFIEKNEIYPYLESGEVPIIYCYMVKYWWLITSNRLLISNENDMSSFTIEKIQSVDINDVLTEKTSKHEYSMLQLIIDNRSVNLKIEPKTWPLMYNILSFIIKKRDRPDTGL